MFINNQEPDSRFSIIKRKLSKDFYGELSVLLTILLIKLMKWSWWKP